MLQEVAHILTYLLVGEALSLLHAQIFENKNLITDHFYTVKFFFLVTISLDAKCDECFIYYFFWVCYLKSDFSAALFFISAQVFFPVFFLSLWKQSDFVQQGAGFKSPT